MKIDIVQIFLVDPDSKAENDCPLGENDYFGQTSDVALGIFFVKRYHLECSPRSFYHQDPLVQS